MNGRLEHELQTNNHIKDMLEDMPEYVTEFYYSIQATKSPMTCQEYIRKIRKFLNYIGDLNISNVTETNIQMYLESIKYIKEKGGKTRKASVSYIKTNCAALDKFFTYLSRHGYIEKNPLEFIERPTKKDIVKRDFLSFEHLNKMLDAARNDFIIDKEYKKRNVCILYLFMTTGMKRKALSEINIENIDLENNVINVVDKGDKEQVYTITPQMRQVLMDWLEAREKLINEYEISNDALFISTQKRRISVEAIGKVVGKYSEIGIGKRISPHKLRAAFASIFYEQTHDIEATREAVGHSDISTTKIYITKRNSSRKQAAEFMSGGLDI